MEPAQQVIGSGVVFGRERKVTEPDSSVETGEGVSVRPGFSPFFTNMAKHLHGGGAGRLHDAALREAVQHGGIERDDGALMG